MPGKALLYVFTAANVIAVVLLTVQNINEVQDPATTRGATH